MYKFVIVLLVGIIVGLIATQFLPIGGDQPDNSNSGGEVAAPAGFNDEDIQQRLIALENQLTAEIGRRNELEALLATLAETQAELPGTANPLPGRRMNRLVDNLEDPTQMRNSAMEIRNNFRQRMEQMNSPSARSERLQAAGFPADQANWIIEQEEEIRLQEEKRRLDALQQDWERRREQVLQGSSFDWTSDPIRAGLSPDEYDRYLRANGRPTSVGIGEVISGSPAAMAGLQPGDEILSYNGERVYNVMELNNATVQGEKGEPVVLGVKRDGVETQISMARGPLGIASNPAPVNFLPRGRRIFTPGVGFTASELTIITPTDN